MPRLSSGLHPPPVQCPPPYCPRLRPLLPPQWRPSVPLPSPPRPRDGTNYNFTEFQFFSYKNQKTSLPYNHVMRKFCYFKEEVSTRRYEGNFPELYFLYLRNFFLSEKWSGFAITKTVNIREHFERKFCYLKIFKKELGVRRYLAVFHVQRSSLFSHINIKAFSYL